MVETIQHGSLKWQHITNPNEDDFRYLLEDFNFHPLDIEDVRSTNQRPKIDEYDDYYFLILNFPYFDKGNKNVRIREVKIFWGKDYIITVGKSHWVVKKFFDEIKEELEEKDEDTLNAFSCSDLLLYTILDRLMLETYQLILSIGSEVDLINYDIFNKKARNIIELISTTRRNVILLNTSFKPQLRVLHMFESGGIKGFADPEVLDMEDYWGDILDQYQKMYDLVEDYGELTEGLSQYHYASADGGGQPVWYERRFSVHHQHHLVLGHPWRYGLDNHPPAGLLQPDDEQVIINIVISVIESNMCTHK